MKQIAGSKVYVENYLWLTVNHSMGRLKKLKFKNIFIYQNCWFIFSYITLLLVIFGTMFMHNWNPFRKSTESKNKNRSDYVQIIILVLFFRGIIKSIKQRNIKIITPAIYFPNIYARSIKSTVDHISPIWSTKTFFFYSFLQ